MRKINLIAMSIVCLLYGLSQLSYVSAQLTWTWSDRGATTTTCNFTQNQLTLRPDGTATWHSYVTDTSPIGTVTVKGVKIWNNNGALLLTLPDFTLSNLNTMQVNFNSIGYFPANLYSSMNGVPTHANYNEADCYGPPQRID